MPLVEYSSSSDDDAPVDSQTRKRKLAAHAHAVVPPPPSNFYDLYAANPRLSTQDDPSLHAGRKRAVPHAPGNWQAHLYLEWFPTQFEASRLSSLVKHLHETSTALALHGLVYSELGTVLPLHVSLSPALILRTEQRAAVLESLVRAVKSCSFSSNISTRLLDLDWAPNHDASRWFLVLRIAKPSNNELNRLLHNLNRTLRDHDLDVLYSDDQKPANSGPTENSGHSSTYGSNNHNDIPDVTCRFHISIAWTLKAPEESTRKDTKALKSSLQACQELMGTQIRFDAVKAKIGQSVTSIPLAPISSEEKRAFSN